MSRKAPYQLTIPLCFECHQGRHGVHGMGRKAWERNIGTTELELLKKTYRLLGEAWPPQELVGIGIFPSALS